MLTEKQYKLNSRIKRRNVSNIKASSMFVAVTILLIVAGSRASGAYSPDRIFLLDGSVLNGEPVNSLANEINVEPGEVISGVLKIRVENDHGTGAVVPVIYTTSWGDHASSWVSVNGWAPTGISYYNAAVSLIAPNEGTHYITFGSQGQTHGSYIASLTGWFLGFNSWNDGIDLADMDEIDFEDCMTTGFATFPVLETGGIYGDCETGCTYIKVNVITEPIGSPDIFVSPTSHDFGNVEIGSSETANISISNLGDSDLVVTDLVSLDVPFTAMSPLPVTIVPGNYIDVEINFTPSSTTYSIDVLEICSNDPDESVVKITVEGIGVPLDTDGDGMSNDQDSDDDNDGFSDWMEEMIGTDPLDEEAVPDLDDIEGTTISYLENLALQAGMEKSLVSKIEQLRDVAEDVVVSVNQATALLNIIESLSNSGTISFGDLQTLKPLVMKFLPTREGVYSYELENGYIIHYFTFNEEQMLEMIESPFKAQPYADWMINEIWILADGMGSNLGKLVGKFVLAFRISDMAYDAIEDGWSDMTVMIRSRNDEEGKWALEFGDTLSEVWRKLTGK